MLYRLSIAEMVVPYGGGHCLTRPQNSHHSHYPTLTTSPSLHLMVHQTLATLTTSRMLSTRGRNQHCTATAGLFCLKPSLRHHCTITVTHAGEDGLGKNAHSLRLGAGMV